MNSACAGLDVYAEYPVPVRDKEVVFDCGYRVDLLMESSAWSGKNDNQAACKENFLRGLGGLSGSAFNVVTNASSQVKK